MSIPGTYITTEELSFTRWILLALSRGVTKNPAEMEQYPTLNQFVSRRRHSEKPKQQLGLRRKVTISVSNASNLVNDLLFLCNPDPQHFAESLIGYLKDCSTEQISSDTFVF